MTTGPDTRQHKRPDQGLQEPAQILPPLAAPLPARMALLPNPFPVARWRLHWRIERTVHWPDFEGSALRGLFGHALRRLTCSTAQPVCTGCPLLERCAYPPLFEPMSAGPGAHRRGTEPAAPYIIEPLPGPRHLAPGSDFAADLVLTGPALTQRSLVLAAWQHALTQQVGPLNGSARWLRNTAPDTLHVALPAAPLTPQQEVAISLLTPLRIKRQGQQLKPGELTAADWLFALVRRVADVCEQQLRQPTGFDFAALKQAARQVHLHDEGLQWQHGHRWSNRQQQHMPLDGLTGRFTLHGDLRPFWPLLHLGQWLHVGGKTSFGLGAYHYAPTPSAP